MARAKNTERAEARRRHREQTRVLTADDPTSEAEDAEEAEAPVAPPTRPGFRMPDVRADLAILPGMLVSTKKLWIPFIVLGVSFVVAVLLAQTVTTVVVIGGQHLVVETGRIIPAGIDRMLALFVQLTLPPTSLFVFFIGGFLAPRASYLVGALLGLVDGILWALLFVVSPTAQIDESSRPGGIGAVAPNASDFLTIIVIAVMVGILAAGFAAWYRNFLRQSQERARANRAAREQQARIKAKETERQAREEQRRAAAEARQAARTTTGSKGGGSRS